ncbi:PH domain-containing protein [Planomicrobium sp. CPCC 101079]|uniref:PH domain-containing protein n=1 Tax=Planomicrobium sp. CPCC 101079 TaxID=2599618 RepID=UPI0011B4554F|nr:PH domain-containing protein [Planomicrobium sp. CPCC 101079]TWT03667.1 hypothetical protein FQV28_11655 [Planomicrobium sp. CPCC 101079]
MKFRSKIDRFFLTIYGIAMLVVAASVFLPFFIEDRVPLMAAVIFISTFIVCVGFMLWLLLDIAYVFYPDHLFVKGGLFRSRIPYQEITRVSPTSDIFTRYRILSSRDGVEIFYRSALMGSVKISPADQECFLNELKKRAPENAFHSKPY